MGGKKYSAVASTRWTPCESKKKEYAMKLCNLKGKVDKRLSYTKRVHVPKSCFSQTRNNFKPDGKHTVPIFGAAVEARECNRMIAAKASGRGRFAPPPGLPPSTPELTAPKPPKETPEPTASTEVTPEPTEPTEETPEPTPPIEEEVDEGDVEQEVVEQNDLAEDEDEDEIEEENEDEAEMDEDGTEDAVQETDGEDLDEAFVDDEDAEELDEIMDAAADEELDDEDLDELIDRIIASEDS